MFKHKDKHEQKQFSPRLKGENAPTMGLEQVTSPKLRKAD
jgi:hypothetical protein